MVERVAALLDADFPIDVVIAHLHDANEGSMERQMQGRLFAVHIASEAWNRIDEPTTIVDPQLWKCLKQQVAAAARGVIGALEPRLGESVEGSVFNANNTGTGHRLRLFFRRIGMLYVGKTKKALELRNKLFHDGYLQRRFSLLETTEAQDRYDGLRRIKEFGLRMVFALCDMDVELHSVLEVYGTVRSRDVTPERAEACGGQPL